MRPDRSAALAVVQPAPLTRPLLEHAAQNARKPRTPSTMRAYETDWRRFVEWCRAHGLTPLPAAPEVIVTHLTWLAEKEPPMHYASIERAYAAIRVRHELASEALPTLKIVSHALENIARALIDRKIYAKPKRALTAEQVVAACEKQPDTLVGDRNRVVLLFGAAIAQRRAQISDVEVEDLVRLPDGYSVTIRKSKTDQRGKGLVVYVDDDVAAVVDRWLARSGIASGPLVRRIHKSGAVLGRLSGQGVAEIVKSAATSLGLDPKEYGGHSLRRGFVTSAARAGCDLDRIMRTTGHKSVAQVQEYIDTALDHDRAAGRGLFRKQTEPKATSIDASSMPPETIENPHGEGRLVKRSRKPPSQ